MATSAPKAATKPGSKPGSSPDNAGDQATTQRSKKIIIILVASILLLAIAGAGGAWYYINSNTEHGAGGKSKPKRAAPPVFLPLETFTVNLQTEDTQQFLQVSMTLQVADDAQVDLIKLNMPQVRNRLLLLLSNKKASEILTKEGKKKLSTEILEQIRQPFTPDGPQPEISEVFFTSFVVQ